MIDCATFWWFSTTFDGVYYPLPFIPNVQVFGSMSVTPCSVCCFHFILDVPLRLPSLDYSSGMAYLYPL